MDTPILRRRSIGSKSGETSISANRKRELSKRSSMEIPNESLSNFSLNKILNALVSSNLKKSEKLRQLQKEQKKLAELNKTTRNKKVMSFSPIHKIAKVEKKIKVALFEQEEIMNMKNRLSESTNVMKEKLDLSRKLFEKLNFNHKHMNLKKDKAIINLFKLESQLKTFQKSENIRKKKQKRKLTSKMEEFHSQSQMIQRNMKAIQKLESQIHSSKTKNHNTIQELEHTLQKCQDYQSKKLKCEEEIQYINRNVQKIIGNEPLKPNELGKLIEIFYSYRTDKYNLKNLCILKLHELTEKQRIFQELLHEKDNLHLEFNEKAHPGIQCETKYLKKHGNTGFAILMHFQCIYEKTHKLFSKIERISETRKSSHLIAKRHKTKVRSLSPNKKNRSSYNFVDCFNRENSTSDIVRSQREIKQQFSLALQKMQKIINTVNSYKKINLNVHYLISQQRDLSPKKKFSHFPRRSNSCAQFQQEINPKFSTDITDLPAVNKELIHAHKRLYSIDIKTKQFNQL